VLHEVFIGVDPHMLSVTIEVPDDHESVLATGRFSTDNAGHAAILKHLARRGRTGPGRSRAATAPAGRWPSGCWCYYHLATK